MTFIIIIIIANITTTTTTTTLVITFMRGIYNYIPERNYVFREYIVVGVLYLQFLLHVMLFRP